MKRVLIIALLPIFFLGCSLLKGKANKFQSNSFVGYVEPINEKERHPIRTGIGMKTIYNPNVTNTPETIPEKRKIQKGDCIVIDLIGGYINQSFEPKPEYWLTGDQTRNEVTLAIAVYERIDSTKLEVKPNEKYPTSSEYNVFTSDGQLPKRPLALENAPIYGPRKYEGGDIVFHITMVELDEDEVATLKNEITGYTSKLSEALPGSVKDVTIHSTVVKALTDATFTLSGAGLVAVGINAVELFASAYEQIHKENDTIIQHTFSLTSTYRTPELHQPALMIGYYPLVRLSTKKKIASGLKNAKFDPVEPKLKMGDQQKEPIWLAFRVSKMENCE